MKQHTYLDGNSIGHAAQHGAKQKMYAGDRETTAIYGTLRSVRKIMKARSHSQPIVLWDGRSWRYSVFPDYKGTRDDTAQKQADRDRYKAQRRAMFHGLHLLGVRQLLSGNMEADDLAAMLTRRAVGNGDKVTLITGDQDWIQLVEPGVVWVDHKVDRKVNTSNFHEFTGFRTPRQFIDSKGLAGDSGDNIKPRTGVGKKGAQSLFSVFESADEFLAMDHYEVKERYFIHHGKRLPKKLVDLNLNNDGVRDRFLWARSLMDLGHPDIPKPDKIKASHKPLDRDGFTKFCMEHSFTSILQSMDHFLTPFETMNQGVSS